MDFLSFHLFLSYFHYFCDTHSKLGNMKTIKPLLIALFAVLLAGCNDDTPKEEVTPYLRIEEANIILIQDNTFDIKIESNCDWYVSECPSNVTLDKQEGTGNEKVKAVLKDPSIKKGKIVVSAKEYKISSDVIFRIDQVWDYNHYEGNW